jgi:hypothetical protein
MLNGIVQRLGRGKNDSYEEDDDDVFDEEDDVTSFIRPGVAENGGSSRVLPSRSPADASAASKTNGHAGGTLRNTAVNCPTPSFRTFSAKPKNGMTSRRPILQVS